MTTAASLPDPLLAQDELERFLDRRARLFFDALVELTKAHLGRANYDEAFSNLAGLLQRTMILSDLHGRKRMLGEADAVRRKIGARFADAERTPLNQSVPFAEAIEDLVSREPRLEQSSRELSRLYNTEHVFGLARSSDEVLTKRIQQYIQRAMLSGKPSEAEAEKILADMGDFNRAYAGTVYRTNIATSYSNGRFAQARDPDVAEIIPAMRFVSVLDARTRPNHSAAHGFIAATDDPIWKQLKPPIGFNAVLAGMRISAWKRSASIEKLRIGDKVFTMQGEWCAIYGVDSQTRETDIVDMTLANGVVISLTPEHPVLTRHGWKAAGQLTEYDSVYASACRVCFKPIPPRRSVCGAACNNKQRSTQSNIRQLYMCLKCGSAVRDLSLYCGKSCARRIRRSIRPCMVCGRDIPTHGKKRAKRFCSKICAGIARRNIPDRPCGTCGTSIRTAWLDRGGGRRDKGARISKMSFGRSRRFCSFKCWRRCKGETSIEKLVREYLEKEQIGFVAKEQIGRYEVDFLLPQFATIVECDGTYWHRPGSAAATRSLRRDACLEGLGYKILHLSEQELKSDNSWKWRLYDICGHQVDQAQNSQSSSL